MGSGLGPESLNSITYGLYVVTSHFEGRANGLIANTVFQVTAEPPRVAVSISKDSFTYECISKSGVFSVSVLDKSTPMTFIGLFGYKSGRETDKLSQVTFKKGQSGCPMVTENAISVLEAKVIDRVELGTHTLFIADIIGGEILRRGEPLTYAFFQEEKKGKTPKSAPTHRRTSQRPQKGRKGGMMKYVCDVCGYVYDPDVGDPESGVSPGTAFENLPDGWVCPVCGAGKDQFSSES